MLALMGSALRWNRSRNPYWRTRTMKKNLGPEEVARLRAGIEVHNARFAN
jgi:hypothetical protein